jgi:hypothetical protein
MRERRVRPSQKTRFKPRYRRLKQAPVILILFT